ncbi:MAG TPA: YceI family protein [Candidatus Acidoferrum sp.]|jgi:polyisoprenoid-binding protein YceI|nr:YceI family protein [Candidatus Acidoferrum sp.]
MTLSVLGLAALAASLAPGPVQTPATVVWFGDGSRSSVVVSMSRVLASPITATIPISSARVLTAKAAVAPVAIEARLNAGALRSNDAGRDADLRGSQFFDVARYPMIRFAGDRVTRTGPDSFRLEGALTMRGITHLLTLDAKVAARRRDARGRESARYEARGHFHRSDFGMTYGEGLVGDDVSVRVVLETAR